MGGRASEARAGPVGRHGRLVMSPQFLIIYMHYFDLKHFEKVKKYRLRSHDRYREGRGPGSVRGYKRGT